LVFRLEIDDLLPSARDLIGEDEEEIASPRPRESGVDGGLFVGDDLEALRWDARLDELGGHDLRHLLRPAPPRVVIATKDDVVERLAADPRNGADVLVATVSWRGHDDGAPAVHLESQR